jgi:hypothetical protein
MSFEDVDTRVREALSRQNIVFRTAEEEKLPNFTMLLTENAQKEALEYEGAHYRKAAMVHEKMIKENKLIYQLGDPNATLPDNVFEERGQLWTKSEDGSKVGFLQDPRVRGPLAFTREAYEKDGIEGIIQSLKDEGYEAAGTAGFTGKSSDDVLRIQEQVVEHVRNNNLAAQISNLPSVHSQPQPTTESVSFARRTLLNIIEGSELAAKVMRYKV